MHLLDKIQPFDVFHKTFVNIFMFFCGMNERCWFEFRVHSNDIEVWWTIEVNMAFVHLEEGFENALKDYNKKQARLIF